MNNTKKRSLGRGLSALLESNENSGTAQARTITTPGGTFQIPVEQIEANPFQPRSHFNPEALHDLAESIRQHGVIQPITVRKVSAERYQLISGERRLKALQVAGLTEVPAYVRIANDQAMLELALIENTHREDLDAIEIALGYSRLIEECGLTQEDLSEKVSRDRTTITNYLRLLKLPPVIQLALREKKLTMGHAKALININDPAAQLSMFDKILDESLSVRETETRAKQTKTGNITRTIVTSVSPSHADVSIENELTQSLESKVKLSRTGIGKGKLVISFYSEEELQKIVGQLKKNSGN